MKKSRTLTDARTPLSHTPPRAPVDVGWIRRQQRGRADTGVTTRDNEHLGDLEREAGRRDESQWAK